MTERAGIAGVAEPGARSLTVADLVGTWRLLSWHALGEDGSTREPFGPSPWATSCTPPTDA